MTAPVRGLAGCAFEIFWRGLSFYLIPLGPARVLLLIFQQITGQAAAHSAGAVLGFVFNAFAPRHVLSLDRLLESVLTKNQIIAAVISSARLRCCSFSGWSFILPRC